jgi:hypothetical protein
VRRTEDGGRRTEILLRLALLLLLASVVAATKTDPDLWGHVRFGADMIRDGSVWQRDAYSFTSDVPWMNHEWGSEIAMGAAFLLAGNVGLFALKFGILGGVLLLLSRALAGESVAATRHRDIAVALAVIVTIEQAHNIRPQLFSLLFFSALLACLMAARRAPRMLFALPPLFALWANFHGGWIVGGGVLLLWTAGLVLSRPADWRGAAAHAAAGAASLAATLVNPHGVKMHEFLRNTVGFGRSDIVEWQPVTAVSGNILALWVLVAALAAAGALRGIRTRSPAGRLLVVIALAAASFRVNRLLAFFGLATLFLYGPVLSAALSRRAAAPRASSRTAVYAAVAVSLLLIAGAARVLAGQASCVAIDPRATPGPGAVEFFKSHGSRGRLLVWFDWGEYALWHLAPDLLVSVDGRRETVYSARVQDAHLRFYFDAPGGAALPAELGADYIWIPQGLPAVRRMLDSGWTETYRDATSVILARQRPTVEGPAPSAGARSDRRCFPGP